MEHTLLNGDIMILDKISYRFNNIKRFDIVVIDSENSLIIKRIIGVPGDTIEYKNNKLFHLKVLYLS
jgi:signal peptidase I